LVESATISADRVEEKKVRNKRIRRVFCMTILLTRVNRKKTAKKGEIQYSIKKNVRKGDQRF